MAAVLLAVITIAAGAAPWMQQPEQTPGKNAFKFSVQSQLVEIYLTVARGKQLIPHLKAADFEILEDGVSVPIDHLDDQEVPLQIVLLFDVSGSIGDSLKTTQDAAAAFVESLKTQDRVTLVLFNSEIRAYPQTTDDREPILRIIRNTQAGGVTKLYEALLLGMKYLDGKPGRKAIVCFTDGQDTSGTSSRNAVLNAAARFGFPIYTIGAGAGLELSSLKIILREFAEVNGGNAFFIQNFRKLREAFLEVAAELRSAYVLSYYTRIPSDGRWHDVSIHTLDPTISVRARKGFFAKGH
jgi:Ca-activated chloride channel family protein